MVTMCICRSYQRLGKGEFKVKKSELMDLVGKRVKIIFTKNCGGGERG